MSATLAAENIRLAYGTKVIIPEISVSVNKADIISIIGPNGSGKSTLLKGLARLLAPVSGRVLLNGGDINRLPTREVTRTMAILPQTVRDLIVCGRSRRRAFGALSEKDLRCIGKTAALTDVEKYLHAASTRCPAESGSGPGWLWRWCKTRSCCFLTSRPHIWTSATSWSLCG